MDSSHIYFVIFGIILLIVIIVLVVWAFHGSTDENSSDNEDSECDYSTDSYTSESDEIVCSNITNVWNGAYLNKVKIHLKDRNDSLLSPSASQGNGLCFLGNTSQPLSVVDPDQENDYNWEFDDNGYLKYKDKNIFTSYGLQGIHNNYYLTFTESGAGDEYNTIDCWYGIDNPKGYIYPASMTILPFDATKGCQKQICVSWHGSKNGEHDYITTIINGKTYYLTANTCNNFVFWYSTNKDSRFDKRQLWSVTPYEKVKIVTQPDHEEYDHSEGTSIKNDKNIKCENSDHSSSVDNCGKSKNRKRKRRNRHKKH